MKFRFILLAAIAFILPSCQNDDLETQAFDSPLNQKEIVVHLESNIAIRWTNLFLELERYANGMRPNASARAIAYINMAAYETGIPGMKKCITNENRLDGFQISDYSNSLDIDYEVALNACYAKSLNYFLLNLPSGMKSRITNLETTIALELQSNLPSQKISASRSWGLFVADRVINYSNTDTDAMAQILDPQPLSYVPPIGAGLWDFYAEEERALFPYWESVRTFVISPNQTTSVAPKVYNEAVGSAYYNEMIDVRDKNNAAKSGNTEQLWIAQFWSDDLVGMTFSPPARQISIANQLAIQNDLNLEEVLNLYVKIGFALNDAAVSCWKYKYQYNVMRPNVYIREHIEAAFQTNLYTMIDWPNPSFPGYPSGHSTFASAAGGIFKNVFGNSIQLLDRSHENRTEFLGTPRSFSTVDQLVQENAFSRVPLGVHMRMDCEEGVRLGYEISNAVNHLRMTKN